MPFGETFPTYPGLGSVLWPLLGHMVPTLRGGHGPPHRGPVGKGNGWKCEERFENSN